MITFHVLETPKVHFAISLLNRVSASRGKHQKKMDQGCRVYAANLFSQLFYANLFYGRLFSKPLPQRFVFRVDLCEHRVLVCAIVFVLYSGQWMKLGYIASL